MRASVLLMCLIGCTAVIVHHPWRVGKDMESTANVSKGERNGQEHKGHANASKVEGNATTKTAVGVDVKEKKVDRTAWLWITFTVVGLLIACGGIWWRGKEHGNGDAAADGDAGAEAE